MAERKLAGSPSMAAMFARAGVSMVPGASRLPFFGGRGEQVPDLTLTLDDVETDRGRLADYDRVCGFTLREALPPTYPHMLAFPLQLALMTDGKFPFPAIGLVHIANRIVQHRPIASGEPVSFKVWSDPLEPHPRGTQFTLRTEARVGDELVWEEHSTNLRRGRSAAPSGEPSGETGPPSAEHLPASATWRLPGDLGRRYANVSGDLNPIHVHPVSARLFGFPSAIAHGMWTKARALAALESELPAAFSVEVAFKRPILLPATVEFAEGRSGATIRFGVRDAKKAQPHLDGELRPQ
jgi:acyl dehydratase